MYYLINPEAVIFLDSDAMNGYTTVAYDWVSDDLFLIKPHEYRVLRLIESGVCTDEILNDQLVGVMTTKEDLEAILEEFLDKKIIYEQE